MRRLGKGAGKGKGDYCRRVVMAQRLSAMVDAFKDEWVKADGERPERLLRMRDKEALQVGRGLSSPIGGLINFVLVSGVVGVLVLGPPTRGGSPCLDSGQETPAGTEIFKGITYGCERLEPSEEGSGFVYWVRVDLTAPGIDLYVTPKDPTAVSSGLAIPPALGRKRRG